MGCERRFLLAVAALATLTIAQPVFSQQGAPQQAAPVSDKAQQRIIKEVRHELLMLPYLDVFDYLAYKVDGYNVTLREFNGRHTLPPEVAVEAATWLSKLAA